jgi:hypothetical protein
MVSDPYRFPQRLSGASFDALDENKSAFLRYICMGKWFTVLIIVGACSLVFLILVAALA